MINAYEILFKEPERKITKIPNSKPWRIILK
jgi:hypothetical protein